MDAEFHNLKIGAISLGFKVLVLAINRHYSVLTMHLLCPSCDWSSSSAPKRAVITGSCPTCSGQLWLDQPKRSDVMPTLVAMAFEPGSNLAKQLVAFHRETQLSEGAPVEQAVPQDVAQESRELLSAAILPAPPVVEGDDASATGVFKLPEMPNFQFEEDELEEDELIVDVAELHVEVGESSLSTGDSQEVELEDLSVDLMEAPPVAAVPEPDGAAESWGANVPLPELPAFNQSVVGTKNYDDYVEFNQEPVVVNQAPASWLLPFAIMGLAVGLVLSAFAYGSVLARWQVDELVIPPPTREQMAEEVRARALKALADDTFRAMAVAALKQGDRALALRLYRRYLEKVSPESQESKAVIKLLEDAARFVALKDSNQAIDSEAETDWSVVATQLVTHTTED
jgi:Zn-finger nucleic acid-binding protein